MVYSVKQKLIALPDPGSSDQQAVPPGNYLAIASSPAQQFLDNDQSIETQDSQCARLAAKILARIEARLPCRIRKLTVCVSENTVVLSGQCSTYYTKQVAQHAAMGVLEFERLINNLEVRPAR